ncbi:MAG: TRAP transporter substrate-binding protein DctP, partial [Firmicutes bacterium]|nr:TRAP transporter substrate-binding protein DctP [Bacillota bacterium]
MKTLKKVCALLLAFAMIFAMSACGGKKAEPAPAAPAASGQSSSGSSGSSGSAPAAQPAADPIVLRVGHKSSDTSSWQKGAEYWNDLLKERTNGQITLEIHPNSELGDQKEMTEMAQLGVLDIVLNAPATLASFMTEISAMDLPFLFRDYEHAFACM